MQITYGQNDWLPIGDGSWTWAGGTIVQTDVGSSNPQGLLFHAGSSDLKRTVTARAQITFVGDEADVDGCPGIVLFDGVSLTVSSGGGVSFFGTAGKGTCQVEYTPALSQYVWLKAFYDPATNLCYGKYWLDGQTEPADWQLADEPATPPDPVYNSHFGVAGQVDAGETLVAVDNFSVILGSEVPAFKPWFRPHNRLIGGGV